MSFQNIVQRSALAMINNIEFVAAAVLILLSVFFGVGIRAFLLLVWGDVFVANLMAMSPILAALAVSFDKCRGRK